MPKLYNSRAPRLPDPKDVAALEVMRARVKAQRQARLDEKAKSANTTDTGLAGSHKRVQAAKAASEARSQDRTKLRAALDKKAAKSAEKAAKAPARSSGTGSARPTRATRSRAKNPPVAPSSTTVDKG